MDVIQFFDIYNERYIIRITTSKKNELKKIFMLMKDWTWCLIGKTRRAEAVEGSIEPYLTNNLSDRFYRDIYQITGHLLRMYIIYTQIWYYSRNLF